MKPNLRLSFAKYDKTQTFLGLPIVLIKANNEDPSNLREWISMKLFRRMGVPAPREAPAQVYLNGELLGFYYIVEFLEETFLNRNLGENTGYLYEWNNTGTPYEFENLGADPALYAPFLDLKTSQPAPDAETLTKLIQVIHQPAGPTFTDADFIRALSQYVDPKAFLTYAAAEQAVSGTDGLIGGEMGLNNFYLYQFRGSTLYQFLPWDKDFTLADPARDILEGVTKGPTINRLAQRLASIPEYKQFYLRALVKAAGLMGGTSGWADKEISREYGVIRAAAANDPHKQCMAEGVLHSCGTADFENEVPGLHGFLGSRADFVLASARAEGYTAATGGPQFSPGGISALGTVGRVSPGAIATVAGSALGTDRQAVAMPLPRALGNTIVAVDGVRAPLFSTSPGSITFQVPGDIPPGTAAVVAFAGGEATSTADVVVATATPNCLVVVHSDGTSVVVGRPAVPNERLTLYATGFGAVNPDLPIGSAAGLTGRPPATVITPQVSLGNASVNITYSGLVPGMVGLYQLNLQVPQALPPAAAAPLNVVFGAESGTIQLALQ